MINDISPRTAMGSFPVAAESYGYASDVIPDPDYPEPSQVYRLSPIFSESIKNKDLVISECEALLGYVFKQMFSCVAVKQFITIKGDDILVPTELMFEKVDLWRRLVSDYPAFIIPGDTHDYGIGKFYLEGVGSMLEVTELINDDSVDDNPFTSVFAKLAEYGVHLDDKSYRRGNSSANGRFLLLPETMMVPRRVGEVDADNSRFFTTDCVPSSHSS